VLGPCARASRQGQRTGAKSYARYYLLLAAGTDDDVLEPPVVLQTTLGAAPDALGLVRLLGNLGGLATHLSGARKRSVNLNRELRI
jgi:hypothetical protein